MTAEAARRHNPVFLAERLHLARTANPPGARYPSLMFGWAFAFSVALTGAIFLMGRSGSLTSVNLRETYTFFAGVARLCLYLLVFGSAFQYVLLVWLCASLGADTVVRERAAGTWDTLRLTPLDARALMLGKWWAVVQHVYETQTRGVWLRTLLPLWIVIIGDRFDFIPHTPHALGIVASPIIVAAYTGAGMALAAALGVLWSALVRTHGVAALLTGFSVIMTLSGVLIMQGFATLYTFDGLERLPLALLAPFDGAATLTALGVDHEFFPVLGMVGGALTGLVFVGMAAFTSLGLAVALNAHQRGWAARSTPPARTRSAERAER